LSGEMERSVIGRTTCHGETSLADDGFAYSALHRSRRAEAPSGDMERSIIGRNTANRAAAPGLLGPEGVDGAHAGGVHGRAQAGGGSDYHRHEPLAGDGAGIESDWQGRL